MKKSKFSLKKAVLDLLFPKFCVGCGNEGEWSCSRCQKKIIVVELQVCPLCNKLQEQGKYCLKCRQGKHLKGIIVSAYYEEGPVREMIHNFKYNGVSDLRTELGQYLYLAFKKNIEDYIKIDFITCAPSHRRRLAQRGYNQAELLAQTLAEKTQLPYLAVLKKIRATKRQVELTGEKRRQNLRGAYRVEEQYRAKLKKKTILLIDDVATTGATLDECASILRGAGASAIWGLVVARG